MEKEFRIGEIKRNKNGHRYITISASWDEYKNSDYIKLQPVKLNEADY